MTVKAGKGGSISGNWYLIEPVPGKKDRFRAAASNSAVYQIARAMADGIKDRPDIHFLNALHGWYRESNWSESYPHFGYPEFGKACDKAIAAIRERAR